ncbi:hypothetical protein TNCV_2977451 [Trichonephila clavipes]|nr:hypothetical protein TNCV_2977451 [Trichonephila clavipes]
MSPENSALYESKGGRVWENAGLSRMDYLQQKLYAGRTCYETKMERSFWPGPPLAPQEDLSCLDSSHINSRERRDKQTRMSPL